MFSVHDQSQVGSNANAVSDRSVVFSVHDQSQVGGNANAVSDRSVECFQSMTKVKLAAIPML